MLCKNYIICIHIFGFLRIFLCLYRGVRTDGGRGARLRPGTESIDKGFSQDPDRMSAEARENKNCRCNSSSKPAEAGDSNGF